MVTGYTHIVRDDEGHLRVGAGRHKLIMLVGEHVYRGSGPVQLVEAHPSLTLGQAYAALAYYYDHKQDLDAELERRREHADQSRSELEDPAMRRQLHEGYARWRTQRP